MGHENENNRSTAMTPELLAAVSAATAAAVREAVAGMSELMAKTIQDLAITPEKLREANKPYVDPDKLRREVREKMKFRKDEADVDKVTKQRREQCNHQDKNGRSSIQVVHNFFDRNPRGICPLCGDWIHPKEWRISAPTEQEPDGHAYLVDAHKDYRFVRDLESRQGM